MGSPEAEEAVGGSSKGTTMVRVAVADLCKKLLKPLWKEGTMSREVFKVICKKVVDKVRQQPRQL